MAGLRILVGALWLLAVLRQGAAAEMGAVAVDGRRAIAATGEDFICATLDWWPPDKCDYGTCSWGRASLLNLVRGHHRHPLSPSFTAGELTPFSFSTPRRIDQFYNLYLV